MRKCSTITDDNQITRKDPMPKSLFLSALREACERHPQRIAFVNSRAQDEPLTYGSLWEMSDALAARIAEAAPAGKPVVVYGHKSPLMLASFIAAAKAGRGYAPIDIAYPPDRVDDIVSQIGDPWVLSLADSPYPGDRHLASRVVEAHQVRLWSQEGGAAVEDAWVEGDDIFYLLFTSGSTGRPKGVAMASRSVDAFMGYMAKFFPAGSDRVSFNRVPYTFDVSLFDIVGALPQGYTLFGFERECDDSMAAAFEALRDQSITTWVSTPSCIEACLVDPAFSRELLPNLDTIVLCGEVLRNATAGKILDRFPGAHLYNTYGPTETQAVTDILVDERLAAEANPLPVGYLAPNARALVADVETGEWLPRGREGEIYLAGSTLALGYYGRPDLTAAAFQMRADDAGAPLRVYRTGDKGYLDEEGRLFCLGRLDFQVKLNGFRVELGEVERHLSQLDGIREAVVLAVERRGRVAHLVAHVVAEDTAAPCDFEAGQGVREALKSSLPDYMVPKKIVFHDAFPLNNNGKIDRKALASL